MGLGRLKYPFIAGAAALMSVVRYAVMRAIAER
jgi:hypothetical protein